jgi:CIC family chloride channel protein
MKALAALRRRAAKFFREREDALFFCLCGVVGILGSLIGAAFRLATDAVLELFDTLHAEDISTFSAAMMSLPTWARVAVPALGALLAGLILKLVTKGGTTSTPSGVPDVMEVVVLGRKRARVREVIVRSVASFVGLMTGSSIGREGPLIALGSSSAARIGVSVNLSEESYRILTASGVAAGVAASYHTPLAATLFVVEIIVGVLSMRVLGAAVIAAFAAAATSDAIFGIAPPLYDLPSFSVRSAAEYPAYAVLGALCGAVAVLFMTCIGLSGRLFARIPLSVPIKLMIGGALVGVIGIAHPQVYGNGYDTTRAMLSQHVDVTFLLVIAAAKTVATSVSVGSSMPGGVFTPTLFVGAAVGALFGHLLEALHLAPANLQAGSYGLLGMAGALAGTTHAPLLSTVLVVELTGNHGMILPLLLATLCSWGMSRLLKKESIYTEELKRKGIATEGSFESRVMHSLKVRDLVRVDVELVPQRMTLTEIAQKFSESRSMYLYVGDPDGKLVGAIDLHDVKTALVNPEAGGLVIAQDLSKGVPVAFPEESIVDVNQRLWLQDVGHLPVVKSEEDRTYLGILTRRDVLGAVDREILKRNVLFAPMRAYGSDEVDWFELPPGGRMDAVRVPRSLVGLTIEDAALGRKFNVTIVAVKRRDSQGEEVRYLPQADFRLQGGDSLIVLGAEAAVQKLIDDELV